MPLRLYPPRRKNPNWCVRGTLYGRTIYASAKTRDPKAAQRFKERLELELAERENADIYIYNALIMANYVDRLRLLVCEKKKRRDAAILHLTTFGGEPDSAFRLAACMRKEYQSFRVHVFGLCKSAGTLTAIGADSLVWGDFGELGPLDVQMAKPDEILPTSSGLDIFQALAVLKNSAFEAFEQYLLGITGASEGHISAKTSAEIARELAVGIFAPITGQIEPERLGEMQRAITIATEYGRRLTGGNRGNLKPDALERLVQGYPGHGFVIHFDEAQTLFNNVREADTLERQVAGLLRLRRPASEPIIADLFSMFGATGAPRHVTRQSKKTASRGVQPGKERAENVAELRPDVARHGAPAEEDADSGRSGTQKPPRPPRQVATE